MMAEPKARSQGSNGAGGGALAFTAISAAKVEPAVIASTAAANTSFFMTIPIACLRQSGLVAPRTGETDCNQNPAANLKPANHPVKQKRQASAAFLGVMALLPQVVIGCCIRTTIFSTACIASTDWSP